LPEIKLKISLIDIVPYLNIETIKIGEHPPFSLPDKILWSVGSGAALAYDTFEKISNLLTANEKYFAT